MPDPIYVTNYDPVWPDKFGTLKARAAAALASVPVVTIEHVGSTSVPGLAAKPIIDLDIVVRTAADIPAAIERLATLGYEHEGDLGIAGREAFRWPPGEERHHLYLVVEGNEELRRQLLFRDYLRAHPDVAAAYGELKKELATEFRHDRAAYTDAKTEFVLSVMRKAGEGRAEEHRQR